MTQKKHNIRIELDQETHQRVQQLAQSEGRSCRKQIEQMIILQLNYSEDYQLKKVKRTNRITNSQNKITTIEQLRQESAKDIKMKYYNDSLLDMKFIQWLKKNKIFYSINIGLDKCIQIYNQFKDEQTEEDDL